MSVRTRKIAFLLLIVILELFNVDKHQVYAKRPSIDEFGFKNDTTESEFDGVYNLYRAKRALQNGRPAPPRNPPQPVRTRMTSSPAFFGIHRSPTDGSVKFYQVNAPNDTNGGACSQGEGTNVVVPQIMQNGDGTSVYRESQMTSIPPEVVDLSDITSQAGSDSQTFDTRYTAYNKMKKELGKVKAGNASLRRFQEAALKVSSATEEALKFEKRDHNSTRADLEKAKQANAKLQKALEKLAEAQLVEELEEVRKAHEEALLNLDLATEKVKSLPDLQKDLVEANRVNADLQRKMDAIPEQTRKEIENIKAEFMNKNKVKTEKMLAEIRAYEKETAQLKDYTAEVEANLAALKEAHAQQKDDATTELREVKTQFESALQNLGSRAEDAEAQLMEAVKKLHSFEAKTKEHLETIAGMQATIEDINYSKDKLTTKTQQLEKDIIAAQNKEMALNDKISALITAYDDEIKRTLRRNIATEVKITGLMKERDAVFADRNSWQSKYHQAMSEKAKCDAVPWWIIVIFNWVCTVKLYIKSKAKKAGSAAANRMRGYGSAVSNKMVSFKDRAYSVMQATLAFFNSLPQRLANIRSGRQAQAQERIIMDLKVVIGGILVDAYHIHVYVRKVEKEEELNEGLCYESVSLKDDLNRVRNWLHRIL